MAPHPKHGTAPAPDIDTLAIDALGFLASEPDRLAAFFESTGLSPQTLRAAASVRGFAHAVLDHLMQDDTLLIAFAADRAIPVAMLASRIDRARGPRPGVGETEFAARDD